MPEAISLQEVVPACGEDFADWIIWGVGDEPCPTCDGSLHLVARGALVSSITDLAVACADEGLVIHCRDLPLASQALIQDRLSRVVQQTSLASASSRMRTLLAPVATSLVERSQERIADRLPPSGTLSESHAGKSETTVPSGYRSVSWLRDYEAETILGAYTNRRTEELSNEEGTVIFRAVFHAQDSQEAIKYRANVEAMRVRSLGAKIIGWIRMEEAQAILDANKSKQDVYFNHLGFGSGGLVQYFPPDSGPAVKYRSTTRLLRRSSSS